MQHTDKKLATAAWILVVPALLFLLMAGTTKILGNNPLPSIDTMAPWYSGLVWARCFLADR